MIQNFIALVLVCFSFFGSNAQTFEEVSTEIGLDYIYPGNGFQMAGAGLMVIDINNDGWEDFFQSGGVFDSKLWINEHGIFRDATKEFGLDGLQGYFIQGAVCLDFNNDGFQDFFIVNYGKGMGMGDKKSPVLLQNIEGKLFKIVKMEGILAPGDFSSAALGDFNLDGFVDIYLTNYVATMGVLLDSNGVEVGYKTSCFDNKLLLNINGSHFKECAQEYGVNDGGCGLSANFTDVDNDGDLDLLLLNDFGEWTGEGNKFFRNEYPKKYFSDLSDSTGFNHKMYGMGISTADYDLDGSLEYYITNIGENYLFRFNGKSFENEAKKLGIDATYSYGSTKGTSWSGLFFDVEFDGDLDLFVSKGNVLTIVPKTAISDPNLLFLNEDGIFRDVSVSSGVADILSHHGVIIFDYDHDGDLDIISSVVKLPWAPFANKEQKLKVYKNNTASKNWIGIKLIGKGDINRDCFGCKVLFEQDTIQMISQVDGSSGHASQSTRILYFGLNNAKKLEKLSIYWLNGTTTVLSGLKNGFIYEVSSDGKIKKVKLGFP